MEKSPKILKSASYRIVHVNVSSALFRVREIYDKFTYLIRIVRAQFLCSPLSSVNLESGVDRRKPALIAGKPGDYRAPIIRELRSPMIPLNELFLGKSYVVYRGKNRNLNLNKVQPLVLWITRVLYETT